MVLGFADEMKKLGENIADSCDARLHAVGAIIKNTHSTLKNFHLDRLHMSEEQKAELARFRKNLTDETKKLMADARNMIDAFAKEHKEMATALRADLNKFHHGMYRQTHQMLNEFRTNFESMSEELHNMLSGYYKGEIKKPVHDMLSAFHNDMKKLGDEFHQAHQAWMNFSHSMSAKRYVKHAPEEIESPSKSTPKGRTGGRKRKAHSRKK